MILNFSFVSLDSIEDQLLVLPCGCWDIAMYYP